MTLENRIKRELTSYNGKMGIYLRDFKGNLLAFGEDEIYETASVIKSFILLDLFEQVERGDKSLEDQLVFKEEFRVDGSGVLHSMLSGLKMSAENFAILMIIVSDNTATNIMIDYLGIDRINETIEKYGLLLRNHLNGGHVPLLHGINKVRIDAIDAQEFTLTVEMLHGGEYNQTFYLPPLQ